MKKGIVSSVIISIICVTNLLIFLIVLMPFDAKELIENNRIEDDVEFMMLAVVGAAVGFAILIIYVWIFLTAVTHVICLAFSIRNRRSESKGIRIYNYVLDVVNAFLIIGPIIKILVNLNWEMILNL